jgi:hypothetical protein
MYQGKTEDELIQIIFVNGGRGGVHNAEVEGGKAELTKRLMNAIIALDRSTRYYSKWLIGLTIVLGVLALAQIGIGIFQILNG